MTVFDTLRMFRLRLVGMTEIHTSQVHTDKFLIN